MQAERDNPSSGLLVPLLGVILAVSIFGNSGCTNGIWHKNVSAASGTTQAPTLPMPPSVKESLAGTWICADSQCASDTIKVIGPQLDKIQTDFTDYLPAASPQSICRFREVSPLILDKPVSGPFTNSITGKISRQPFELVQDPSNTHDCNERLAKLNADIPSESENLIFEDDAPDELVLNGITYRRLAGGDAQAMEKSRNDAKMRSASLAGDWDCIEPGSEGLKETISDDLKSLFTESTVDFADSQQCRIRENSTLQIRDITDPQKIYAARTKGAFSLINDAKNTEKCPEILTYLNQERVKESPSVEQLTIERDGSDEIIVQEKRFARRRTRP